MENSVKYKIINILKLHYHVKIGNMTPQVRGTIILIQQWHFELQWESFSEDLLKSNEESLNS